MSLVWGVNQSTGQVEKNNLMMRQRKIAIIIDLPQENIFGNYDNYQIGNYHNNDNPSYSSWDILWHKRKSSFHPLVIGNVDTKFHSNASTNSVKS